MKVAGQPFFGACAVILQKKVDYVLLVLSLLLIDPSGSLAPVILCACPTIASKRSVAINCTYGPVPWPLISTGKTSKIQS